MAKLPRKLPIVSCAASVSANPPIPSPVINPATLETQYERMTRTPIKMIPKRIIDTRSETALAPIG